MSFLTKGIVIGRRDLISVVVLALFVNAWIASFRIAVRFPYFESFGVPLFAINIVSLGSAPAAFFGGFLLDKVRRRKPFFLLYFAWAAISFLPVIFKTAIIVPIYLFTTGIMFGLLFMVSRSFFADHTEVYERGRVGSLIWSGYGLLTIITMFVGSWSVDLYFVLIGVLALVVGLVGVFLAEEKTIPEEEWRKVPTSSIFGDRNFFLFVALAVLMGFLWGSNSLLATNFAAGIFPNSIFFFWVIVELAYVLAFFGGVMMDRLGRRPVMIIGALLIASGIMPFVLYRTFWTFLFTAVAYGTGGGFLWVSVVHVAFGDIARKETRGRVYGMGIASLSPGAVLGSTVGQLLLGSSATIILTFILFTAFLVILLASVVRETLPPKERIEEMRDYIKSIKDKAKKEEE